MPLAVVIKSGVTPNFWPANGVPSRPKPQITFGRRDHAAAAGHRLDDHRRDGLAAVQGAQRFQIIRQLRPMLRLPP
jgi:hypothetical protein